MCSAWVACAGGLDLEDGMVGSCVQSLGGLCGGLYFRVVGSSVQGCSAWVGCAVGCAMEEGMVGSITREVALLLIRQQLRPSAPSNYADYNNFLHAGAANRKLDHHTVGA